MRIGYLKTSSPHRDHLSGVSRYLDGLLPRIEELGLTPSVFWTRGDGAGTHDQPYTYPTGPWAEYRSIHTPDHVLMASLSAWIRQEKPDLIHCHWPVDRAWALLRDAPSSFPPILVSFHTFEPICPLKTHVIVGGDLCSEVSGRICLQRGCRSPRKYLVHDVRLRRLRSRVGERAAGYLVHNRELMGLLRRTGIGPLRYTTFGAETEEVTPAPHPRRPIVLYAGRLRPEKGVGVLAAAIGDILRAVPQAEVRIAGEGSETGDLTREAARQGARVKLLGTLNERDLRREYAAAQLLVMPSTWKENFGLVGVEAMAHGTPVVAPATGGIREWLRHEENGLEIPRRDPRALAEAAVRLLQDPSLTARLGRGAADTAKVFGMRVHARALVRIYEDLHSSRAATMGSA